MGHSDVVTVDPKKWTFPPFSAARDGGYIHGRGTLDDKPHVVAGLMTMLKLKRLNVPLDRDVIFMVESGEEGTTGPGIGFMTSKHADAIAAEFCLAEGGSIARVNGKVVYSAVQAAEKTPRTVEPVANGPSGHASRPLQGNAVVHLAAAVAAAGKGRVPVRLNDTTRSFFPRMAEFSQPEAAARFRAILDPTSAAGRAADDYFVEHEPNYASMLRTDTGEQRPVGPPANLQSEAFRVIQSVAARNYDTATLPMMSTGATDMSQVRAQATQCYGVAPATDVEDGPKGFGAHSDQERILEAEIYRFVRFSYEIVYDLARRN